MTKFKLRAVAPHDVEANKPKMLIYGRAGVGKTWTALDFPSVYYIDSEGGANLPHYMDKLKKSGGVYLGPDNGALSFDVLLEQISLLCSTSHGYKTLVIDSISKIFAADIAAESSRLGDKNGFGADKKPAVRKMQQLVSKLPHLDMNVILVAHEAPQFGTDSKGERTEIGTTFDCWSKLEYELHLCLQIRKQGESRVAQVKKSRLTEFPDGAVFPWTFAEFSKRYGSILEREPQASSVATPEQLEEFFKLISEQNISEEQQLKWLQSAGILAFEDMPRARMDNAINFLKNKKGD
jgi:hypothetical protein